MDESPSRAAEARCWFFFLTRGLPSQIGKMARDGSVSEGACAYLHDGLGRAPRGAGAHADLRGGGGGDVERHGSQCGRREIEWSARATTSIVSMSRILSHEPYLLVNTLC